MIRRIRLWLLWQSACLADAILSIRRLWRRWWYGKPGRHGTWQDYNTAQMTAIEDDLAARPWALKPAPALLSLHPPQGPAPGPELFHHSDERLADDSFIAGIADALLRATSPRLYQPHETYWQQCWADFNGDGWRAWETGLPELPADMPAAICQAA